MPRDTPNNPEESGSQDPELQAVLAVLPLIGRGVDILQPLGSVAEDILGGGDIDCVVDRLDQLWPLRLPSGIRLLQCIHYDITGWHWILEVNGRTVKVDTLVDPNGIGVYGLPTRLWFAAVDGDVQGVRAAYLTSKRIRKGVVSRAKWDHVRSVAAVSPSAFRDTLGAMFGPTTGERLAAAVADGGPPPPDLRREAELRLMQRRLGGPLRSASFLVGSAGRVIERVMHPTGLVFLVAGPDGSGKSTLAAALPQACEGPFRRSLHFHWRPDVLPAPGRLAGVPEGDPTQPHARPPHGRAVSIAKLLYYWLDFLLGEWMRLGPARVRSALVVVERGWWDIAVDPRRYRMNVPPELVTALGRFLPKPDVAVILEAPSEQLLERKREISAEEAERQSEAWRTVVPAGTPRAILDASKAADEVRADARRAIFDLLESRALSRLGPGWVALPTRPSPRWLLPRGRADVVRSALTIYQPVTPKGRAGWEIARLAASAGMFRLAPRGPAPPLVVRNALRSHLPAGATVATMRANHPNRYVAAIISAQGHLLAIAKVAGDDRGREALVKEAEALARFSRLLPPPVRAPAVLDAAEGLLLLEACPWRPRTRPWMLPDDVAGAVGGLYRSAQEELGGGAAHGDLAPWNLLQSSDGWVLIDWEHARQPAPPFFDLFHYIVQSHGHLKRPSQQAIVSGVVDGDGWIGRSVRAYAVSAGIDPIDAIQHLPAYLESSVEMLDRERQEGRTGMAIRRDLARAVERLS